MLVALLDCCRGGCLSSRLVSCEDFTHITVELGLTRIFRQLGAASAHLALHLGLSQDNQVDFGRLHARALSVTCLITLCRLVTSPKRLDALHVIAKVLTFHVQYLMIALVFHCKSGRLRAELGMLLRVETHTRAMRIQI